MGNNTHTISQTLPITILGWKSGDAPPGPVEGCTGLRSKRWSAPLFRHCTGRTAHRGSRGIVLPFHDDGTRRGWGVSVTPRPIFTPGKNTLPIVQEAGWPQGRSGQVRKISPLPGFDCRTVQPVASRYTDYATRPTGLLRGWLYFRIEYVNNFCMYHVALMGESRGAYKLSVGKPEEKRPLERPRGWWKNNIKMDLQNRDGGVDWFGVLQDMDQCWVLWTRIP